MTLPGYDRWKTASPPEGEEYLEPCANCGHDYEDHPDGDHCVFVKWPDVECIECDCDHYVLPEPPERDPDEAYDRRHERGLG